MEKSGKDFFQQSQKRIFRTCKTRTGTYKKLLIQQNQSEEVQKDVVEIIDQYIN